MSVEAFKHRKFSRVTLLGTGLMGGSLGMSIRERGLASEVIGYDRDKHILDAARERGAIDCYSIDPENAVKGADLVVLALPVRFCGELILRCAPYLSPGAIITDLGSTKNYLVNELSVHLPADVTYIGGHPMTGSEESGIWAADPTLWENAIYVLTPDGNTSAAEVDRLKGLVTGIGAQPLILSPEEHDGLVAVVSHLPHLVAVALVNMAAKNEKEEMVRTLAAGGFRDTTRIAMGNPEMWRDICATNRHAINKFLNDYLHELENIRKIINEGKESELEEILAAAGDYRRKIPYRSRGILPELFDIIALVKDNPGTIGKIATILGEAEINIAEVEILHVREEEGGSIRFGFRSEEQRHRALQIMKARGYRVHRR